MFIIEKLVKDHHRKIETWKVARDKWVDDPQYSNYYRDNSKYERDHPRPGTRLKIVFQLFLAIILVMVIVGGSTICLIHARNEDKKHPKEQVTSQASKDCASFNKNDRVRIQYGDYVNLTGHVVGGCGDGQDYQVKLDANQKANISHDGNSNPVDVGNTIIGVNNKSNLVVIKE